MEKIGSGLSAPLSGLNCAKKSFSREYFPEAITAFAFSTTLFHCAVPVYTCALRYAFANSACATHFVGRPYVAKDLSSLNKARFSSRSEERRVGKECRSSLLLYT